MQLLIYPTSAIASEQAFNRIQQAIQQGAKTLGLATGGTPEQLYTLMRESDIDFSEMTSINLDEYYGLAPTHPKSYHVYMNQNLFDAKPFKQSFIPNGENKNVEEETSRYEEILTTYPIDLQILGIGSNGHIGFNEPGTAFDSKTSLVQLTDSTIQANKRYFQSEEEVPKQAYSMGIGSILKAKEIILLAFGEQKAKAIQALMSEKITTDNPASALHQHPNVTIIVDEAAASLL
ncbi:MULTISPECIES: glucosamine-6-phosphate deaminase [unclassified Facklamia]|uniref:glucosamine-6-phosphate deaminase n=1 Tax=Aerococcaceae TaxID=186827 RepID=UPI0013B7D4AB|nr:MULTISPECIES: glucosamine-6-phosphate deaminase [unclassified Facklamia]MBS4461626.1 glucosamine-6-phosphate deaminase [Aerococcaceae bacterium zg-B36]NEW63918.1 glucosamine-6-phosphate deaminase [Facklamia sp. 252]NEW67389.1 glucosamine-6-phosphate deaminase [Facklamia sp. 253]QQD65265.1 glucosamine-6-phosphate deaminase [Aerococcaceae bacterium zg-252]